MSHDQTQEFPDMNDLDLIEEACREMGIETERNATRRGYAGRTQNHDLVMKLDRYDVGFDLRDGKIAVTADQWGVNLGSNTHGGYGEIMNRVKTGYTVALTKQQMARSRRVMSHKQTTTADGKIQLRFRVR